MMRNDLPAALAAFEATRAPVLSGERTTSGPRAGEVEATWWMARLESRRGNAARAAALLTEALAAARKYIQDFPTLAAGPLNLACIHAARDEMAEALRAFAEAERIMSDRPNEATSAKRQRKAEVLGVLGRTEAAIAELRSLHEREPGFGYTLRVSPEWEPLRGDPKFQQLMKEAEAVADAQPRPQPERPR
jgi:tetratricopeptide (TPR) repeat protein